MKKVTALLLAAAMSLALASCGSTPSGSAASSSGDSAKPYAGQSLVVQVWGGTYEETLRQYVIPAFEESTGAKVEVVSGATPVSLN